ncbi:MAG: type II toxin-antitoxin system RelE/ParE family toxin [Methanobrevibacter sp.]|jgi:mRNA-degrading endonuclease RelE of RelBE toxin-antitoxin system|nr:type II toxin-antitoxin system RelE/ParE family toxin [Candidatus Methanoflexus mossambicus]
MKYEICVDAEVNEYLEKLKQEDPALYSQLINAMKKLKEHPQRFKQLKGKKHMYSLRSGKYRILYYIEEEYVNVMIIGHRKNVYKFKE